jgi:tetratricopeptide (TPR) repeat protein
MPVPWMLGWGGRFLVCAVVWGASLSGQAGGDPSVELLFEQYGHKDFDAVLRDLQKISDWRAFAGNVTGRVGAWPRQTGAAFALDCAVEMAAADGQDLRRLGRPYMDLLDAGFRRVRQSEVPDEFERRWYLAAVALRLGLGPESSTGETGVFTGLAFNSWFGQDLQHALKRFPEAPELRFEEAEVEEAFIHEWLRTVGVEVVPRASKNAVLARQAADAFMLHVAGEYRALLDVPTLRAEARLRLGVMTFYAGQPREALGAFDDVQSETSDEWLRYLSALFRGRALAAVGELDQAQAAFRQAIDLQPGMPSAELSLASVLFVTDHRGEAARLVAAAIHNPAPVDPWAWYPYGDFRHLPGRLRAMRAVLP